MKRLMIACILSALLLMGCGGGKFAENEAFSAFQTVNFDGEEVTEGIFKEKDMTMVHFWGSTCGPCLEELPVLQEIYEKLPENVTMIGVLADVPKGYDIGIERATNALAAAKASFPNLVLDEVLKEYASSLTLTPFTVFVDKEGKIVKSVKGAAKYGFVDVFDELVPNLEWKK